MTATGARSRPGWRPDPMTVAFAALVLLAEFAVAVVAVQSGNTVLTRPLFAFGVPFVWINGSLLAFAFVRPGPDAGRRLPAVGVAAAYFVVLAALGGLLTWGGPGGASFRVTLAGIPGWVPMVVVGGDVVNLVIVPFKLLGYLALTYLVYVTVREASGALVGGVLGLFSCVSCSLPIVAALVSGLAGGGGAAATAAYSNSYTLSTVVFAVTVALLAWRPSVGDLRRLRNGK